MNYYNKFRETNVNVAADGIRSTIVSVNLKQNTCVVVNVDNRYFLLPIEILISDMENDMCHINNFSKLRRWTGFEDEEKVHRMMEGCYPSDYFDDTEKYISDITKDVKNGSSFAQIYKKVGKTISQRYLDRIKESNNGQITRDKILGVGKATSLVNINWLCDVEWQKRNIEWQKRNEPKMEVKKEKYLDSAEFEIDYKGIKKLEELIKNDTEYIMCFVHFDAGTDNLDSLYMSIWNEDAAKDEHINVSILDEEEREVLIQYALDEIKKERENQRGD